MSSTRFEKLLRSCSRERLITQSPYEVKERTIKIKRRAADGFREGYAPLTSVSKPPSRTESEWQVLEDEIKAADFIVEIQSDEGVDDFVPYSRETLSRATDFLKRYMIHANSANLLGAGVPRIGPADRGSIDLYWESADRTLLINFPSDTNVANYYGQKQKREISGRFESSEVPAELVVFLAD